MLKVAIFDSGWGGEMFADFVEQELATVEVIRVIDWRHAPYCRRKEAEVRGLMEQALKPYIGRVSVIVIASNLASAVGLEYLRRKYPGQKFTGFEIGLTHRLQAKRIVVITTRMVRKTKQYKKFLRKMDARVMTVECDDWISLIDDGEMTKEKIKEKLEETIKLSPEVAIFGCTHLNEEKKTIEKVLGWQTVVVDGYGEAFRGLCRELGLRGVDGKRRRG